MTFHHPQGTGQLLQAGDINLLLHNSDNPEILLAIGNLSKTSESDILCIYWDSEIVSVFDSYKEGAFQLKITPSPVSGTGNSINEKMTNSKNF